MSEFPKSFVLNGADYFLLQLDRIMFRSSSKHNVCTFVVELKERLELNDLEESLANSSAYQWINRLRINKRLPFSLTKWIVNEHVELSQIKQHQLIDKSILDSLLATEIKINKHSPFKIDLIQTLDAKSILVFTWHHSIMDAHGGEAFIQYLGNQDISKTFEWFEQKRAVLPLQYRAKIAQDMKSYLHTVSELPLISLYKKKSGMPTLRYRTLSFNEQHSQLIILRAKQHGAGFFPSTFYLATTAYSVATIQQKRAPLNGDLLVPIPLDRRRRGSDSPIIGNQVSFLFYRMPKKTLSDLHSCTKELVEQMKNLMKSEKPEQGSIMMDFMRRVPGSLYRFLIKKPTAGLMASFFFSDTGDVLQNSEQLFSHSIGSAVHYPPTMYPPGMTFVFSRFRGCLQITFGYMEDVINEDEVEQLFNQLRDALLGNNSIQIDEM